MNKIDKICIIGGGNLGTVIACVAASKGYHVDLLTGHPDKWNNQIHVNDLSDRSYIGVIHKISDDPSTLIPDANMVLACLPGNAVESWIMKIKPFLKDNTPFGSVFCSSGFFPIAIAILGEAHPLFGLQRVPFIARLSEYGKSAQLLGYKKDLKLALWHIRNRSRLIDCLSDIFMSEISILSSPLSATLTNSNPLIHPSRLYNLFKDFDESTGIKDNKLFYGEWDNASSETLILCDNEFQTMLRHLGIGEKEIIPILEYYESSDIKSLTKKITSIESWHNILSPMIKRADGTFAPDWTSRYFVEDIPNGLFVIKVIANHLKVNTPEIDKILHWYHRVTGQQFINETGDPVWNDLTKSIPTLNPRGLQPLLNQINTLAQI